MINNPTERSALSSSSSSSSNHPDRHTTTTLSSISIKLINTYNPYVFPFSAFGFGTDLTDYGRSYLVSRLLQARATIIIMSCVARCWDTNTRSIIVVFVQDDDDDDDDGFDG